MDAQGVVKVSGLGSVSVINVSDLFSRVKVDSFPCLDTSHPSTQDYQLVLRRAFVNYGLPERISLDHDSVFYDNASASPFPSMIHLWLIALGIDVRFIEKLLPPSTALSSAAIRPLPNRPSRGRHSRMAQHSRQACQTDSISSTLAFLPVHWLAKPLW